MAGARQGKMVRVMNFESLKDRPGIKANFKSSVVEELLRDERCAKLRILGLTVNGKKRIGKSFLVNLMINFLQHLEMTPMGFQTWLQTNPKITGVKWDDGDSPVTKGIWMWNRPFVIKLQNDEEVAVLLMDCQGFFDQSLPCPEAVDAIMTSCGLAMFKIHLLNVERRVNEADLKHLEVGITLTSLMKLRSSFDTLFLVRRDTRGSLGMQEQVDLERPIVEKAFRRCMDFKLPQPCDKILDGKDTDGLHLQELVADSKDFMEYVEKLFQLLFVQLPKYDNFLTTREELWASNRLVKEQLANGKELQEFASSAEAMERCEILRVYHELETAQLKVYDAAIDTKEIKSEGRLQNEIAVQESNFRKRVNEKKREIHTRTLVATTTWSEMDTRLKNELKMMRELKEAHFKNKLTVPACLKIIVSTAGLALAGTLVGIIGGPVGMIAGAAVGAGLGSSGSVMGVGIEHAVEKTKYSEKE